MSSPARSAVAKFGIKSFEEIVEENEKLRWILTQCPLMNAPDLSQVDSPKMMVPFSYCNPKTFREKYSSRARSIQLTPTQVYWLVGMGRTKWILTDLLPEGGVIFTPNLMPGL